jgi:hypothetical protein
MVFAGAVVEPAKYPPTPATTPATTAEIATLAAVDNAFLREIFLLKSPLLLSILLFLLVFPRSSFFNALRHI